jgi:hypothetical protein
MKTWWVYAEDGDEAGQVAMGNTAEEALMNAIESGFEPGECEVWAYELGKLHYLGVQS